MIKLPPLKPCHWMNYNDIQDRDIEVAKAVLEAAAKECVKSRDFGGEYASPFVVIANAIRALEFKHE